MLFTVDRASVYAYTGSRAFDPALPTVVFVHGAAHDHSVWALQSRYFAHHGWNSLALDLPGHGRSGAQPLAAVPALADWTVRTMDTLGLARAAICGHSMGALTALDMAGRYPERVTKLALIAPSVPMPVSEVLLAAARANDHLAYDLIIEWSFSPDGHAGGNTLPGVWMTGNDLRLMERSRPGALYADLCACNDYMDGLASARAVRSPALIILGGRDRMAPPRNAQALISALADKRVVTFPEAGHSLMSEAPDAVLDALRKFL